MHLVKGLLYILAGLVFGLLGGIPSFGQDLSVDLRWDPNAESNLAGYNIYRSNQPRTGYYRLNSRLITQTSYRDEFLTAGHTYFYVCTAVNTVGLESGFSNEVSYRAPGPDPDPDQNSPPIASNDVFVAEIPPPFTINVLVNDFDPDGDDLSIINTTQGSHGSVTLDGNGMVMYTPGPDFAGEDSFRYTISDGQGNTDTARVTVESPTQPGGPGNQPPSASPDEAVTSGGVPVLVNVLLNDMDPDGDILTVVDVTRPKYGDSEIHDKATVRYSPEINFEGTDQFEYIVTDGKTSVSGLVSIAVRRQEIPHRTLVFPTLLKTDDPLLDNTYVGIGLLNPGLQANSISLSAHDPEGSEIITVQLGETLRPSGQAAFLTSEVLDSYSDSVTVAVSGATGPLMGFFMLGDYDLGRLDGVGAELPSATELYVPNVRCTELETSLLHVINREEEAKANIAISLFDTDGSLRDQVTTELDPLGSAIGTVSEIFGGDVFIEEGYLGIFSDVSVSAFSVLASDDTLSSLAARPGAAARFLVAPQFLVDGSGANRSVLRLLNTDSKEVRVRLRAYGDDAQLLASDEFFIASQQLWVEDLSAIFETIPDSLVTGYLEVEIQGVMGAASSIVSSITFETFGGQATSTLPLQEKGWREAIFPHVAQTSDGSIYTGFSLLNLEDRKNGILIEAFDQDGRLTARKRLNLQPGERAIDVLRSPTFFGPEFEQIKGHIRIESTRKLIIFAIFGDAQGEFLSTIEGQKPPN